MPWNCLCSKGKKRPQISAPILEPNEYQKHQIIPSNRPIVSSDNIKQTFFDKPIVVDIVIDKDINPNKVVKIAHIHKKSQKQKSKVNQSNCQVKDSKKLLSQNQKPTTKSQKNCENEEKLIKSQIGNVTFSLNGPNQREKDLQNEIPILSSPQDKNENVRVTENNNFTGTTNCNLQQINVELIEIFDKQQKQKQEATEKAKKNNAESTENGNYDELPFIITTLNPSPTSDTKRESSLAVAQNQQHRHSPTIFQEHLILSTESIPFIDDNQRAKSPVTCQNFHNARIIDLMPKNFESHHLITVLENESTKVFQQHQTDLNILTETSTKHHFQLNVADNQKSSQHSFRIVQFPMTSHVCQLCHLLLNHFDALKCITCDFLCHRQCVEKPDLRFTDTSYLIHKQWTKSHEQFAFPTVFTYFLPFGNGIAAATFDITNHTNDNNLRAKPDTKIYKIKDVRKKPQGITRKKSKYSEKKKNRKSVELTIKESQRNENESNDEDDGNDIPIIDLVLENNNRKKIDAKDVTDAAISAFKVVNADIHRYSSSNENDESNNNSIKIKSRMNKTDSEKLDTSLIIEENYDKPHFDKTKEHHPPSSLSGVIVKRKRYSRNDIDKELIEKTTSSSMDTETDTDLEVNYAKVELRKKVSKNDLTSEQQQQIIPKSVSFPISFHHATTKTSYDTLRINYVTEKILASILPDRNNFENNNNEHDDHENDEHVKLRRSESVIGCEDQYERELITMLEQKHGKNYRIFDLESCISIITLEKLCELCKHVDSWLGSGREKVVVLQDRGDRQRLGAAIAAYLEYQKICGSNFPHFKSSENLDEDRQAQNKIYRNWLDLDVFSMQKFLEDIVGPLKIPSYQRYIQYFAGLLSGNIKINSAALYLRHITLESPPCLYHRAATNNNEWRSFIKIYEGKKCVFISDVYVIPITTRQFIYELKNPLRLRGDVTVKCYQMPSNNSDGRSLDKELISSIQFHTCAIREKDLKFTKSDIDLACYDERFNNDHKWIFNFSQTQPTDSRAFVFQNPLVRTEQHTNSYDESFENLSEASSYTHGPLDGSLYATILKSPKSPTRADVIFNALSSQLRGSTQHLISPPAEFNSSSLKIHDVSPDNRYTFPLNSSTPNHPYKIKETTVTNRINYSPGQNIDKDRSARNTPIPTPSVLSNRNHRTNNDKSQYYLETNRQSVNNHSPPNTQKIQIIETRHYTTDENGYGEHVNSGYQTTTPKDGRESVKSPLTLSMDSGISSSGIVNRRIQDSSASPSSFPSQTSPQEDRHRELDEILSDMLMISDFGNSQQQKSIKSKINHHHQYQQTNKLDQNNQNLTLNQQHQQFIETNTIKRSQSYTPAVPVRTDSRLSITASSSVNGGEVGSKDHRLIDLYETSSTTTTLTPPPSERGDTPTFNQFHSINTNTRFDRESNNQRELQHSERELIMNLQQKSSSFGYSQLPSTDRHLLLSEDSNCGDSIPYHARENSKPFSYGNIPKSPTPGSLHQSQSAETMIRSGSGLSSPSMVRKALGTPTSVKNLSPRNDFEDMLRERREKVLKEKYSISDKTPNGGILKTTYDIKTTYSGNNKNSNYNKNLQSDTSDKWYNSGITNGYHEPLKRSNTMDGSFGRSQTSDGISGQTWLQLQQQKLRAKKEQQNRDHVDTFTRTSYGNNTLSYSDAGRHRTQTLSPVRNENRNYHTMTTTTKVEKTERPFVAVKRAYEEARHHKTYGSAPSSPLTVLNTSPLGHIAQINQNTLNSKQIHQTNGLLSLAHNEPNNQQQTLRNGQNKLAREESFSSYRSETDHDFSPFSGSRPETPAFPVTPRTPYGLSNGNSPALPPKSPTSQRKLLNSNNSTWSLRSQNSSTYDWSKDPYSGTQRIHELNEQISTYTSRRNSQTSNANSEPQEVPADYVKYVRDSSKFWYKPNISREEAISLLRHAQPGTFVVRDSTTFANAFGLVVKVAHPPPGVERSKGPPGDELVRHFLVEPTLRGVRLKGCSNEPVFSSLSALVYQHSITPLALPCRLIIPDRDILHSAEFASPAQQQLITQGAACNVLYLYTAETESLTGPQAVRKAVQILFTRRPLPTPTQVHFKVSQQGITLTDNTRQLFFRKHYPANSVSFCGVDPDEHRWSVQIPNGDIPVISYRIFAFVAKRSTSSADNQCHLFCELEPSQPATAIVSFANKVLLTSNQQQQIATNAL